MNAKFAKEYLCEPMKLDPKFVEVAQSWLMYYMRCERYDRMVCTGPMGRDGIRPMGPVELGRINGNANHEMKIFRADNPKAKPQIVQAAKRYVLQNFDFSVDLKTMETYRVE